MQVFPFDSLVLLHYNDDVAVSSSANSDRCVNSDRYVVAFVSFSEYFNTSLKFPKCDVNFLPSFGGEIKLVHMRK